MAFYPGGDLEQELHDAKIPLRSLNKRGRWDAFGFLWRLVQLIRNEKPQVLHGVLVVPNIMTAFLKPIFPTLRLTARGGSSKVRGHGHIDLLSFKCMVNGERLITDQDGGGKDGAEGTGRRGGASAPCGAPRQNP